MKGKKIIVISSESWGKVFVSKHHFASYLSESNEVYFLNPPSIPWNISSFFNLPVSIKSINENLRVIDYGNPLPGMARLPKAFQLWSFNKIIREVMRKIGIPELDLVWSFDLKRFYDLKQWHASRALFHAVELIDHPFFINEAPFRHDVIASADAVVSIADLITKQAKPFNTMVKQLNHGIDIQKFDSIKSHKTLPGSAKIKAGFVGNFQVSFDFALLNKLAEENQDVDFIMIGPKKLSNLGELSPEIRNGISDSEKRENIHFIGKVDSYMLPEYQSQFDINLVIYGDDFTDGHCNPHKLMSYFYFGKVTVSSFIDQYKDNSKLIVMAGKNENLPNLFAEVKNNLSDYNNESLYKYRHDFALRHDYPILIGQINQLIFDGE